MNVKSVFILYSSCNLYLVFEISAHTASDLWKFCLISSQQFSFFLSGFTKWHSGRGRGNCPQNFWLSENCPNILCLWEIFRPKTKFEAENHNFEENLGAKLKFLSTHNLLCWNLQLSIGKCNFLPCLLFKPTLTWNDQIWKNRSVRRKNCMCVCVCMCCHVSSCFALGGFFLGYTELIVQLCHLFTNRSVEHERFRHVLKSVIYSVSQKGSLTLSIVTWSVIIRF